MDNSNIAKSSQEQAVAAWINYRFVLRMQDLAKRLADQDLNLDAAMAELKKFEVFISDPFHILGSPLQKHGEIAEHAQVRFHNAEDLIEGRVARHDIDSVPRLDKADYLRNGHMVQSKFYMGEAGTLRAITTHLKTYPTFLADGGEYDIPKSQFEYLINIYRNGESGTITETSDAKMYDVIKDWESINKVKFPDVVKPSLLDYDQVQLDTAPISLQTEQDKIQSRDHELREQVRQDNRPTTQDAIKVTTVSIALEAGTAFAIAVYQKRKTGKKLLEFSSEDWYEISKATGIGGIKGAVRGSAVFYLTNYTEIAAPMANAMVTATLGMMAEAYKLQQRKTTPEDFILSCETICLDVSISALSSVIGQVAIPIPVLGSIIGNTVGLFMENIAKSYLSAKEEQLICAYKKSIQEHRGQLSTDHAQFMKDTLDQLNAYEEMAALAFDENPTIRLSSAQNRAVMLGVPKEQLLSIEDFKIMLTRTEPINL